MTGRYSQNNEYLRGNTSCLIHTKTSAFTSAGAIATRSSGTFRKCQTKIGYEGSVWESRTSISAHISVPNVGAAVHNSANSAQLSQRLGRRAMVRASELAVN